MPGWQQFLDIATKDPQVKSAGIFGQDGVAWATAGDLTPAPAEVRDLVAGVRDNSRLHENGVVVGGAKYMFVSPLPNPEPGLAGVVARKGGASLEVIVTGKAVIVATTDGNLSELTGPVSAAREMVKMGF